MKKSGVLGISALLVAIIVAFISCDTSSTNNLKESFKNIKAVSPVPGAQNATMNLQSGDNQDSYFVVKLDDGSTREGWCIEWNKQSVKGVQDGVKLFSTKGHEEWRELNYFMSVKNNLKANDPNLTFREIQVVIWSLVDNPTFNVDKIAEYKDIDPNIFKDGHALFDVQKVKNILSMIDNHFTSAAIQASYDDPGVYFIENDGQTVMVGEETAYAVKTISNGETTVDDDYSTCFEDGVNGVSFSNWGWTNGPISAPSEMTTYDIYAGAGQCDLSKGTLVGTLTVSYFEGTFKAIFKMTETSGYTGNTYTMSSTHLYVGNDPFPMLNGSYTVAPGQYGHQHSLSDATEDTYTITGLSGDIYFIAHADVDGFGSN